MRRKKKKERQKRQFDQRKILFVILGVIAFIVLILFFKWLLVDRVVSREEIVLTSDEGVSLVYKTKAYAYFDKLGSYKESLLTNQEKLWFVVETDEMFDRNLLFYTEGKTVSGADVVEFYKRYFGNDDIKNEDILCPIDNKPIFEYDSETGVYRYSSNIHAHGALPVIYDKYAYPISIEKLKKANGEILYEVKMHKMFGDYCSDICELTSHFYGTYEDSLNQENAIVKKEDYDNWEDYFASSQEIEKIYSTYQEQFPVYKYTFVFENNDYYLKSVRIVK